MNIFLKYPQKFHCTSVFFWAHNINIAQVSGYCHVEKLPIREQLHAGKCSPVSSQLLQICSQSLCILECFCRWFKCFYFPEKLHCDSSKNVWLIVRFEPQQLFMYILVFLFLGENAIYISTDTYSDCIFVDFCFDPAMWFNLMLPLVIMFL